MKFRGRMTTGILLTLFLVAVVIGVIRANSGFSGDVPIDIGATSDGQLRPCPDSPNCVCSIEPSSEEHSVEPLLRNESLSSAELAAELEKIAVELGGKPRVRIVSEEQIYLHFEFQTSLLGFVDDVELLWREGDPSIAVRSASRIGHSDFGVNRRRVERIRQRLSSD